MSCHRVEEIDLMAFAADRMASEWEAFRAHYPGCPDCARAVGELAAFEALIRQNAGDCGAGHVSEDELIALDQGRLSGAQLARVEAHVDGCAMCRTERSVLRAFEIEAASEAAAEVLVPRGRGRAAVADRSSGSIGGLSDWLAGLLRPGPALGFAAAVAVALLVLWSLGREEATREPPRYAEEEGGLPQSPTRDEAPDGSAPRAPEAVAPEPGVEGESFYAEDSSQSPNGSLGLDLPPATAPESPLDTPAAEAIRVAETPPTEDRGARSSPTRSADDPSEVAPAPDSPGIDSGEREVVLLAALLPSELPSYARPEGAAFGELDAMRVMGALRSGDAVDVRVSVLAPDHLGATTRVSPRLYWVLDRATRLPIEIVVGEPDADEPLFEKRLEGPFSAGLHSIDLAREGIRLGMDTTYVWSVALIPDADARERDVVSMGGIRRIADPGPIGNSEEPDVQAREVHRLAQAGSWYDAMDRVNRWIEEGLGGEQVRRYRNALMSQADLETEAQWLRGVDRP